ncbi:transcription factor HES-7.1-A-like [Epinephelus moara]|uniref:transcription factor HES-7.1-A-like n=1 Tax=Epinephelus moara TaxID=300413 RepID=UPI00214E9E50|nr:transcription factor HES-7.1-A-like [Epinephelus moara]
MRVLQETEDATNNRKLIKSQVEKRRRERMNRSLERLRTMLQEPEPPGGTQHRVEKAEILEHTVLFLQNTAKGDKTRAGGGVIGGGGGGGRGGKKHSFQDGFSTCLQKATQFLGPEGKGLWLGAALNASFVARLSRPDSDSAGAQRRTEARSCSSLPRTKSILRMLKQRSKQRLHTRALNAHPYRLPAQQVSPQQAQRHSQVEVRVESGAGKQSPSQSCPINQTLWRPWP